MLKLECESKGCNNTATKKYKFHHFCRQCYIEFRSLSEGKNWK